MKKKVALLLSLVLLVSFCFTMAASAASAKTLPIMMDDKKIGTAKLLNYNDVEYISLESTARALGWKMGVDASSKQIILQKNGSNIVISPATNFAQKNGFGVRLVDELIQVDGTVYIPKLKLMDLMEVQGLVTKDGTFEIRIPEKPDISKFTNLGKAQQVILVTAPAHDQTLVTIRTYEKRAGNWVQVKKMPGVIGRNGFEPTKREGDGRSPVGIFTLGTAFGTVQNPGTKMPYRVTTADDIWVDDAASPYYNTWQSRSKIPASSYTSKEDLMIPAYKYAFVIDYNTKNIVPGNGSAIFFHVKGEGPTAGCTAVEEKDIVSVLKWLDPAKNPIIIQGAVDEVAKLK